MEEVKEMEAMEVQRLWASEWNRAENRAVDLAASSRPDRLMTLLS